jgi:beta-xylosidase
LLSRAAKSSNSLRRFWAPASSIFFAHQRGDGRAFRLKPDSYRLKVHRTGFRANDAYSVYIDMGAPRDLTPIQLERLNLLTRDLPEIDRVVRVGNSGSYAFSLRMHSNDVVLVMLEKVKK